MVGLPQPQEDERQPNVSSGNDIAQGAGGGDRTREPDEMTRTQED